MANRMDVDNDSMPDDTRPKDLGQRMKQVSEAVDTVEQGDFMDISEPKQEALVTLADEEQGGQSPNKAEDNKQKSSVRQHVSNMLGLLPRAHVTHQGPQSMNVESIRSRFEVQRKNNEALRKAVNSAESKVELLESQIDSSTRINEKLRQENQDYVEEIVRLMDAHEALGKIRETEKQEYHERIARLTDQVKTLTSTSDQLRQMLVPVSEKQVPDSEVVSKFTSLRSGILALVRSTWKLALQKDLDLKSLSKHQRNFFQESPFPASYDRLRFLVFHVLDVLIFDSRNYFLEDRFQHLEETIQSVEEQLDHNTPEEDEMRVIEWRNATFVATENFRGDGSRLSSTAQDAIWRFLSPLQLKSAAAEQNGRNKLKAVCDNAVELSLMIRQLKDAFLVDDMSFLVGKPASTRGSAVEDVETVVADDDHEPGTIAYVISGALMKTPKENVEQTLILEKAQVAVYE